MALQFSVGSGYIVLYAWLSWILLCFVTWGSLWTLTAPGFLALRIPGFIRNHDDGEWGQLIPGLPL